jgi:N6-adenosine-specific RNA methylase IME4
MTKHSHPFGNLKHGYFGAILIDAPLAFDTWTRKGEGRTPQHHYTCMSPEQLAVLPIADLAAPDCFIFSWIPPRSVFLVEPLMLAWGFNFSGRGFVWIKLNKSGVGYFMGGGYSTRKNAEDCWLGRRGKPKRKSASVRELIIAPVREHSRKPDEIYERIEEFCDGPYLELFARQRRPGWTCWGDEVGKFPADHSQASMKFSSSRVSAITREKAGVPVTGAAGHHRSRMKENE